MCDGIINPNNKTITFTCNNLWNMIYSVIDVSSDGSKSIYICFDNICAAGFHVNFHSNCSINSVDPGHNSITNIGHNNDTIIFTFNGLYYTMNFKECSPASVSISNINTLNSSNKMFNLSNFNELSVHIKNRKYKKY
jgi:hypothetical protein